MGPDLMEKMRAQAERFGAELVTDDIVSVDLTGPIKTVVDGSGRRVPCQAPSSSPWARATASSACPTRSGCPARRVLVRHLRRLLLPRQGHRRRRRRRLRRRGGHVPHPLRPLVTLVHRRDELRASKIMQERAFANEKIDFAWNSAVEDVHQRRRQGERHRAARHRDRRARELDVTGLFVAIGHDPRSELVRGQVDLDDEGYVVVEPGSTRHQRCPASSPAATSSTTPTARPSRRPGIRLRGRPRRRALPRRQRVT
jgi:thioredoxin reductase (NADPH)